MRVLKPSFLAVILLIGKLVCFASPRVPINLAEAYLLSAANQERGARGIAPLVWDATLAAAAGEHARLMASRETISHHFAEELDLSERGALAGARFSLIAENVAEAPLAVQIHDGWMHSEGHRANLLDPEVDAIGIAVVFQHGQLYAVEDFAHITRALAVEEQETVLARLLAASGLHIRSSSLDARLICKTDAGNTGENRSDLVLWYSVAKLDRLPDGLARTLARGHYRGATVGACDDSASYPFSGYRVAILLYR